MHIKTVILITFGYIFLGLGAVGLFLPLLPTTPFVLLSAACFSASPKLKAKIMKIPFFKEYIENYQNKTGLRRKTVWISMIGLWGMLILSAVLMKKVWVCVLLFCVGAAVTWHILWIAKRRN